jgi:hypothetical protein
MVSNADQESTMVLKIERFQPEGMNIRMSGGKPSYSHVVTVSGSGKIVYTADELARDIDGNCAGKGDMRAQMEQTPAANSSIIDDGRKIDVQIGVPPVEPAVRGGKVVRFG